MGGAPVLPCPLARPPAPRSSRCTTRSCTSPWPPRPAASTSCPQVGWLVWLLCVLASRLPVLALRGRLPPVGAAAAAPCLACPCAHPVRNTPAHSLLLQTPTATSSCWCRCSSCWARWRGSRGATPGCRRPPLRRWATCCTPRCCAGGAAAAGQGMWARRSAGEVRFSYGPAATACGCNLASTLLRCPCVQPGQERAGGRVPAGGARGGGAAAGGAKDRPGGGS